MNSIGVSPYLSKMEFVAGRLEFVECTMGPGRFVVELGKFVVEPGKLVEELGKLAVGPGRFVVEPGSLAVVVGRFVVVGRLAGRRW